MNPGPELDALIAEKIMGWTMSPSPFGKTQDVYQCWHLGGKPLMTIHVWSPSTDIVAAWEVAKKMNEGVHYGIDVRFAIVCSEAGWCAGFQHYSLDGEGSWEFSEDDGIGKTAPHAICLAALKAHP